VPNDEIPGVPEEENPFERHGDVASVPYDSMPKQLEKTRVKAEDEARRQAKEEARLKAEEETTRPGPCRKLPPPRRSTRLAAKKKKATLGSSSFKKTTLGSSFEALTDGRTLRRSARLS
jgi:hypothetical protein